MRKNFMLNVLLLVLLVPLTTCVWAGCSRGQSSRVGIAADSTMVTYLVMDSCNALLPHVWVHIGEDSIQTGWDGRFCYLPADHHVQATLTSADFETQQFVLSRADKGQVVILRLTHPITTEHDSGIRATRMYHRAMTGEMADCEVATDGMAACAEEAIADGAVMMSKMVCGKPAMAPNTIQAGKLTAGEVNDFAKWNLWHNVLTQSHKAYTDQWQLRAAERYMLQVVGRDAFPIANRAVSLLDAAGNTIYQARTDNTGRAELWNGLTSAPVSGTLRLAVDGQAIVARPFSQGENVIRLNEGCEASTSADVFFIVDATGSMGDELHYLQAEMQDVISRSQSAVDGLHIRTGALVYRDHGDAYLTRISCLSDDHTVTQAFLNQQVADGGGDFPEAIPEALMATINAAGWSDEARARIAFLVLDAPCHNDSATIALLHEQILQAAAYGIRIVPVVCSGLDEAGELLMRSIALATNGTSFFLTDDSGIGGKHLQPTTDTLRVEHLNDMLVRTIIEFTRMPDCNADEWLTDAQEQDDIEPFIPNPTDDVTDPTQPIVPAIDVLRLMPNPCTDVCYVELLQSLSNLYVVDLSGKTIMSLGAHAAGERVSLPVANLSTGVYFVKTYHQGRWVSVKMLKR